MTVSDSISHHSSLPSSPFTDVRDVGMVAGAVVGISLGVLIVILIIWLVFRKKEKKKYEEEETPNEIRFNHPLFIPCFLPFCTLIRVKIHVERLNCTDVWDYECVGISVGLLLC